MSEIHDGSSWNYETLAACEGLWIERSATQHVRELVAKAKVGAAQRSCPGEWLLADWLKEWIEREAPDIKPNVYSELLQAALVRVDWHEVAGHLLNSGEGVHNRVQVERSHCGV